MPHCSISNDNYKRRRTHEESAKLYIIRKIRQKKNQQEAQLHCDILRQCSAKENFTNIQQVTFKKTPNLTKELAHRDLSGRIQADSFNYL